MGFLFVHKGAKSMRLQSSLFILLPTALAVACQETTVCPANTYNAVGLTVVDSATGQPPSSAPTVSFSSGSFTETASNPPGQGYFLGAGRTGDFEIRVQASGYAEWRQSGHVDSDRCGRPITVSLTAKLQRSSP
jgi:hypothetical protein